MQADRVNQSSVRGMPGSESRRNRVAALALAFVVAGAIALEAQVYPRWFLEQGRVPCPNSSVGYARPAYYQGSAAGVALLDAQCSVSKCNRTTVQGGELFWQTALGTSYMGHDFVERFDTTACDTPVTVTGLDTFATSSIVVVLASRGLCGVSDEMQSVIDCEGRARPTWVEKPPRYPGYIHAVGSAPVYYFETSSWVEAERRARMRLARTLGAEIRSLERSDNVGRDALVHDDLSVTLEAVQVVARWREGDEACHVLMRMPIEEEEQR